MVGYKTWPRVRLVTLVLRPPPYWFQRVLVVQARSFARAMGALRRAMDSSVYRVLLVRLLPLLAKLHVPRVLLVLTLVAWQSRHA